MCRHQEHLINSEWCVLLFFRGQPPHLLLMEVYVVLYLLTTATPSPPSLHSISSPIFLSNIISFNSSASPGFMVGVYLLSHCMRTVWMSPCPFWKSFFFFMVLHYLLSEGVRGGGDKPPSENQLWTSKPLPLLLLAPPIDATNETI